ncbi:MAG: AAA family ATPase [Chitinophagaceae bacterium]
MELIERSAFISELEKQFSGVKQQEGHCVFVSGEAGIGKTSLVKAFVQAIRPHYKTYTGTCDALFTPRPLSPLLDVLQQLQSDLWKNAGNIEDRTLFFASCFGEMAAQQKAFVIVFEDIHWADEATLDFIKFFARRIAQLPCLFILTYRDNEIDAQHPLRNTMGQLSPDSFTRIQLPPLSVQAVEKLANEKGYNATDIYKISGGNPFYVNEILASYSSGVPDNIKDSILSVYNRQSEATKYVWQLLSVAPAGFEMQYLEQIDPALAMAAAHSLESGILVLKEALLWFKHELYRITIETSLSPFVRVALNKKIIDQFSKDLEATGAIERIIHHAKNANAYDQVLHYAPLAAKKAAAVGAHIQACRLYLTAIEYYQGNDKTLLVQLYEAYAYECYLTNQVKNAIIYTGKALACWKEIGDTEKTGNSLRFLSRLWWYDGNRANAEAYAAEAIAVLAPQPPSAAQAMAYSNMAQLKMLSDEMEPCIEWGEKAIAIATTLGYQEVLSHALNNVGTVKMRVADLRTAGKAQLQQSLAIALENGYHEHAARAYTNLGSTAMQIKDYVFAAKILAEGIDYCEKLDLDAWQQYMLFCKAKTTLETGDWKTAELLATNLLQETKQAGIVKMGALAVLSTIKIRKGDDDALAVLQQAKTIAVVAMELQRILPVFVAALEYEWLTGEAQLTADEIEQTLRLIEQRKAASLTEYAEFIYWVGKTGKQTSLPAQIHEAFDTRTSVKLQMAAAYWKNIHSPYQQGLVLFEGNEDNKRTALCLMQELGATAVYEKMKGEMRGAGIKNIPRGSRKSTLENPKGLTDRELDVLQLLKENLQNKEIAGKLFISAKTVDHHISSLLFKLDVNTRARAVQEALRLGIIK